MYVKQLLLVLCVYLFIRGLRARYLDGGVLFEERCDGVDLLQVAPVQLGAVRIEHNVLLEF